MRWSAVLLALVSLPVILSAQTAGGETAPRPRARPDEGEFIRYNKGEKVARLETAAVTYENVDTGRKVVLLSCVHIGDKSYYEDLQKRLADFEVVLYEGVTADKDESVTEEMLWITRFQLMLKDYLGLEYQKDHIKYTAKNLVHADMTAAEVKRRLAEEGVDLIPFAPAMKGLGPLVEAGLKYLADATQSSDSAMLRAMRSRMKTTMAGFLGNGLKIYERFKRDDEKKRDLVVIQARNDVVLQKLDDVFQKTAAKKVAILYGSAHMPDLGGALVERQKMKRSSVEWIPAWTIPLGSEAEEAAPKAVETAPESRPAEPGRRRI